MNKLMMIKVALLASAASLAVSGSTGALGAPMQYEQGQHATIERPCGHDDRRYSDRSIHDRVHAALEAELGSIGEGIVVQVHRGVVTLSGEVPNEGLRQDAHAIAHDIAGVRSVKFGRLVARDYAYSED